MSDLQQHSLKDLDTLVQNLGEVRGQIANHEAALKTWKAREKALVEVAIPELVAACGDYEVVPFKLQGKVIEIVEQVFAGITEEKRDAAFKWLRENNEGGMIKEETRMSVHTGQLKAWVRGKRDEGVEIPEDLFGVYVKKIAKVK